MLLYLESAVLRKIAFQQDMSFQCGNAYLFGSLTDHLLGALNLILNVNLTLGEKLASFTD